ncbi:MAG: hypothetical protein AAGM22_05625 [Acidobacteriota bacterium]
MTPLIASVTLAAVTLIGGDALRRRAMPAFGARGPTRLAAAWLLGQLLLSGAAVVCLAVRLPLTLAPMIPLIVAVLWRRLPDPDADADDRHPPVDPTLRGIAALTGLLATAVAARTPGLGWDGLAIWGLKARTVAELGHVPWSAWLDPGALSMHPEYPLHLPLLGAVFASIGALADLEWSHSTLPLLSAFDVAAVTLLLVGSFEQRARAARWPLRILLAGGLLTPIVWRELPEGKADLTLALCVLAMTIGAVAWLRHGQRDALLFAALAGGLGAWTKQEGLVWLALASLFVLTLTPQPSRRQLFGPALLAGLVAAPWHVVRLALGLATEPFAVNADQLDRLPPLAEAFGREVVNPGHWGLLWIAALPVAARSVIRGIRGWRSTGAPETRGELFPAAFLLAAVVTLGAIFLATPHDLEWHLATALDRVLLPLWPVALLTLGVGIEGARGGAEAPP